MYDFARDRVGPATLRSFILHEILERRRKIVSVVTSSLMNEVFGKYYNKLGIMADALIFVSRAQMNLIHSLIPYIKDKSYLIYNPIPNYSLIKAEKKGVSYFGGKSFAKGFYVLMRTIEQLTRLAGVWRRMYSV
ncbi:hypothetical protein IMZ38_02275 [Thermosphaera chiliense]|uniref:Uncharacterized protein n=1 Tax=Thermosphaera chiliense TaxID=3402707 RepID=A0A7M1UR87_9CREN|nr:hypothetical protein [Thermosphaera aggregans]QOR94775.1 hypothetical protein IMZ38_02275 [Thermosphaera aggregans]